MLGLTLLVQHRNHEIDAKAIAVRFMRLELPTSFKPGFSIFKNLSWLPGFKRFICLNHYFSNFRVDVSTTGQVRSGTITLKIRATAREFYSLLQLTIRCCSIAHTLNCIRINQNEQQQNGQ